MTKKLRKPKNREQDSNARKQDDFGVNVELIN